MIILGDTGHHVLGYPMDSGHLDDMLHPTGGVQGEEGHLPGRRLPYRTRNARDAVRNATALVEAGADAVNSGDKTPPYRRAS